MSSSDDGDVRHWLNTRLKTFKFSSRALPLSSLLSDGIDLCLLISPLLPHPLTPNSPAISNPQALENISLFLKSCSDLSFTTSLSAQDIRTGTNTPQLLSLLRSLMQKYPVEQSSSPSLSSSQGPETVTLRSSLLHTTSSARMTPISPLARLSRNGSLGGSNSFRMPRKDGSNLLSSSASSVSSHLTSTASSTTTSRKNSTLTQRLVKEKWPSVRCWLAEALKDDELGKIDNPPPLITRLKSGVLLCRLADLMKPDSIPKPVYQGKVPFMQVENITKFLQALRGLGMSEEDLFEAPDLTDERNVPAVLRTLEACSKYLTEHRGDTGYSGHGLELPASQTIDHEAISWDVDTKEEPKDEDEADLVNWANSWILPGTEKERLHNLHDDVRTGAKLIVLVEKLTKTRPIVTWEKNPNCKRQCTENIECLFRFIEQNTFKPVAVCTPADILAGNTENVMALLKMLREKFDMEYNFQKLVNIPATNAVPTTSVADIDLDMPEEELKKVFLSTSGSINLSVLDSDDSDEADLVDVKVEDREQKKEEQEKPAVDSESAPSETPKEDKKETKEETEKAEVKMPSAPVVKEELPPSESSGDDESESYVDDYYGDGDFDSDLDSTGDESGRKAKKRRSRRRGYTDFGRDDVFSLDITRNHKAELVDPSSIPVSPAGFEVDGSGSFSMYTTPSAEDGIPKKQVRRYQRFLRRSPTVAAMGSSQSGVHVLPSEEHTVAAFPRKRAGTDSFFSDEDDGGSSTTKPTDDKASEVTSDDCRPSSSVGAVPPPECVMPAHVDKESGLVCLEPVEDETVPKSPNSRAGIIMPRRSKIWRCASPSNPQRLAVPRSRIVGKSTREFYAVASSDAEDEKEAARHRDASAASAAGDARQKPSSKQGRVRSNSLRTPASSATDPGTVEFMSAHRDKLLPQNRPPTFQETLQNPYLQREFEIFLKESEASEGLDFIIEADTFARHAMPQAEILSEANRIFSKFLSEDSPSEVNISGAIKQSIRLAIAGKMVDSKLFVKAREEAAELLQSDLFPTWTRQPINWANARIAAQQHNQKKSNAFLDFFVWKRRVAKAKDVMRKKIVTELLNTEDMYLAALESCKDMLSLPHEQVVDGGELSKDQVVGVFTTFSYLHFHQKHFRDRLREKLALWSDSTTIGDLFLDSDKLFGYYEVYCAAYSTALARLHTVLSLRRPLRHRRLAALSDSNGTSKTESSSSEAALEQYMVLPSQRLPQYLFSLMNLQKYTTKAHSDFMLIQKAIATMRNVVERVMHNIDEKSESHIHKLISIAASIEGPESELLVMPRRRFIREGYFTSITITTKAKVRSSSTSSVTIRKPYCFMFDDILVCCTAGAKDPSKSFTFSCQLEFSDIRSIYVNTSLTITLLFNDNPEKKALSWTFRCPSEDVRFQWESNFSTLVETGRTRFRRALSLKGQRRPSYSVITTDAQGASEATYGHDSHTVAVVNRGRSITSATGTCAIHGVGTATVIGAEGASTSDKKSSSTDDKPKGKPNVVRRRSLSQSNSKKGEDSVVVPLGHSPSVEGPETEYKSVFAGLDPSAKHIDDKKATSPLPESAVIEDEDSKSSENEDSVSEMESSTGVPTIRVSPASGSSEQGTKDSSSKQKMLPRSPSAANAQTSVAPPTHGIALSVNHSRSFRRGGVSKLTVSVCSDSPSSSPSHSGNLQSTSTSLRSTSLTEIVEEEKKGSNHTPSLSEIGNEMDIIMQKAITAPSEQQSATATVDVTAAESSDGTSTVPNAEPSKEKVAMDDIESAFDEMVRIPPSQTSAGGSTSESRSGSSLSGTGHHSQASLVFSPTLSQTSRSNIIAAMEDAMIQSPTDRPISPPYSPSQTKYHL